MHADRFHRCIGGLYERHPLGQIHRLAKSIGLAPGSIQAGEQIVLHLSHAAGSNVITASYDLYDANGVHLDANGSAPGLTATFSNPTTSATIFSDEDFTQAQIQASSATTDPSYKTTHYGTLVGRSEHRRLELLADKWSAYGSGPRPWVYCECAG